MKPIVRFLVIILMGLAVFYTKDDIAKLLTSGSSTAQKQEVSAKALGANVLDSQVASPAPLKVSSEWLDDSSGSAQDDISASDIVLYSNKERAKNNLPELSVNQKLNESAGIKLDDMISKQYFDHVSPDQIGIKDLGDEVGYAYIIMGENLAYGDFKNSEALVSAWMASPTHRANMLNAKYNEIGVAVKKVSFQGKDTWVAVQHFGAPLSKCPPLDQDLKQTIEANQNRLETINQELNLSNRGAASVALAYITNFKEVKEYNNLIEETKTLVDTYNVGVADFNNCINK